MYACVCVCVFTSGVLKYPLQQYWVFGYSLSDKQNAFWDTHPPHYTAAHFPLKDRKRERDGGGRQKESEGGRKRDGRREIEREGEREREYICQRENCKEKLKSF